MKRVALAISFGLALIFGEACSLLTPLDGLSDSNSAADASPQDSGSDPGDGPSAEAASAPTDAQAMDAGSFCQRLDPRPTFCDDFDRSPAFGEWDKRGEDFATYGLDDGGTTDRAVVLPESPPYSARIRSKQTGCDPHFSLFRTFSGFNSEIHVRLRVRRDTVTDGSYFGSIFLPNQANTASCVVIFDAQSSALGFHLQKTTPNSTNDFASAGPVIQANVWFDLEVDIVNAAGGPALSVSVDGARRFTNKVLTTCPFEGIAELSLTSKCGIAGTELHFDNVVVDVK